MGCLGTVAVFLVNLDAFEKVRAEGMRTAGGFPNFCERSVTVMPSAGRMRISSSVIRLSEFV